MAIFHFDDQKGINLSCKSTAELVGKMKILAVLASHSKLFWNFGSGRGQDLLPFVGKRKKEHFPVILAKYVDILLVSLQAAKAVKENQKCRTSLTDLIKGYK